MKAAYVNFSIIRRIVSGGYDRGLSRLLIIFIKVMSFTVHEDWRIEGLGSIFNYCKQEKQSKFTHKNMTQALTSTQPQSCHC